MTNVSRPRRYTRVAIIFHWTIAALIVTNLVLGFTAAWSGEALHRAVLDLHKPLGLTILALSLARLAWRLGHRPPELEPPLPALEAAAKSLTHLLFYVLMVAIPFTGWWLSSAVPTRHPINFLYLADAPFLPVAQSTAIAGALHDAHERLAILMTVLLALHLSAVAKHYLVTKDRLLARMGIGDA